MSSSLLERITLAVIAMLFGFMVILQFQTIKHPKQRDTRDVFQLQSDLAKAQKEHIALNDELAQAEQLLNKYDTSETDRSIQAMNEALKQQKIQAGVTERVGKGDSIVVKKLIEGTDPFNDGIVTDVLIRRLINNLNQYGAISMAVAGERIINLSPIRMVHNDLLINDQRIPEPPFTIKVLASDPEKLKNQLDVSSVLDDFAREGLTLEVTVDASITLPAYESPIEFHSANQKKGGS